MSQTKKISLLLLAAGMATAGGLGLDELSRETTNHNAIEGVQIMGGSVSQAPGGQVSRVRWPWTAAAARLRAVAQ